MGICGRGTKAKSITSCDNAFVTYIVSCRPETLERSGCFLCESVATATNVLSARKRSVSGNKAPSRNGNHHTLGR
ncbi:hypothetical protein ACQKNB_08065 [Lysinibacillus xylanilyticus]|uniref:hypothetical protein n=1 Tax=Lysinibacillus xylanilyticus TaxID=582475 RepID=UPI003D063326